ncbi:uncharacterized protein F5891DRAFT_1193615 [Suillus fuscotomentosus]|uniref:Uncharacterized protein n=1 Tax=Suillus fuscotomentosus TaxID=1912939 RepID=A0AAD4DY19_9AGAM|nr:uncharacterized protein F5891DRAFT_1193615 [Suillus fuscotomentosus]KAG1895985.1 hypothetical protein F5891DRAFT_1193615 [Suillus fuscotomentosus]
MPKVSRTPSRWRYCRHFKPLTIHCEFPPERACTPPPLTQHTVFSRDTDTSIPGADIDVAQPMPPAVQFAEQSPITKIPKPHGEVSRINHGGYNLQEKLGWSPLEYEEIRNFVTHLANEYLKVNKTWRRQAQCSLTVVYTEAKKRYPILGDYQGDWAVGDMLRIYLKNSSSHST